MWTRLAERDSHHVILTEGEMHTACIFRSAICKMTGRGIRRHWRDAGLPSISCSQSSSNLGQEILKASVWPVGTFRSSATASPRDAPAF